MRRHGRHHDWFSGEGRGPHAGGRGGGMGGGFGGGPGGGMWGGGRRRARMFEHGDLKLVVLKLIGEKPRHGYELIKAIEDKVGGAYSPSAGVIYPTLTLLEELGQVSVEQAESKKLYSITEAGRVALSENAAALQGLEERMAWIRDKEAGGPPPQILRAMENLKMALRLRLSGETPSEEQINAMAAALDAAATQIERS